MRPRHGIGYALLTLAAGAAVLFTPGAAAVTGGLLLALVLPGFAATEGLLRGRTLARVERAVLAPALSLAVLVLAGLVIYVVQLRLDRVSWTVATVAVTLAGLLVASAPKSWATLYTRLIDALVDEDEKSTPKSVAAEPETRAVIDVAEPVRAGAGAGRAAVAAPQADPEPGQETRRITVGPDDAGAQTSRIVVEPVTEAAEEPGDGDEPGDADETRRIFVPPRAKDDTLVLEPVAAEQARKPGVAVVKPPRKLVWQLAPLLLVAAFLVGASWLSYTNSRDSYTTTVTALSAAPSGPVGTDGNRSVVVSATGLVAADGPYTLVTAGSTSAAGSTRTIAVTETGTWSQSLTLPGDQRITVTLHKRGEAAAYRTLYLSAVE